MKHIQFKTLRVKNFLSIGNDGVTVNFNKGLHIITGVNRDKEDRRNGVGKSSISESIYFAIFGTTLRSIKKEFISNNITNKPCEVQLDFDVISPSSTVSYTIIRGLSPSRLVLFRDGVDITRDSISNTTTHIEHIISSTPEIFQNCVIMTINDTVPFMSKSKTEKRKFIEQIFNLQVFSDMTSHLREEYNETKRSLDIENTKHTEIKGNMTSYNEQKAAKIKSKEKSIADIKQKIAQNNIEITKVTYQLSNFIEINKEEKTAELEKFTKALSKIDEIITQSKIDISTITSTVRNGKISMSKMGTTDDVCPVCLRPITDHDQEHIVKEKVELTKTLETLVGDASLKAKVLEDNTEKKSKISKHIDKLNKEITSAQVQAVNKEAYKKRISDLTELNKQIEQGIETITVDQNLFDDLIKAATEKADMVSKSIDTIRKKLDLLDVVKFVISEEGVKSFLIKKILQNFNSRLSYYLKKLDSNSICIFNEYFEEELLNEKGKMCSYNNFSGAERKAIDLACLFSFIDMRKMQGNVSYNISIDDELLDTSLDQKGVELVTDILKDRIEEYNESIFIISHRKESVKAITGEVVFLEKLNGITRRVEFTG